ncbi:MAG: helix-turn-helix domain-containing protein [Proteobacteria bacterium]|nr:helix-turn-helix domain-containing protein [Pseudomonadota bacterium]
MATTNNITTMLRSKGITLAALADELCVSVSTVTTVASGKSMSYTVQKAIAERLGTTIEELWPGQVRLRRNRAQINAGVKSLEPLPRTGNMAKISDSTRYLLSRHPTDMERGFTISTAYGDLGIYAEEAAPFAALTREVLIKRLAEQEKIEQRVK